MPTKNFYGQDARKRILAGSKELYDGVRTTYGLKGLNVLIDRANAEFKITHDGVSVAEAIDLPVTNETLGHRSGARFMQSAADKLKRLVGDATSTVTIVGHLSLEDAHRRIKQGYSPQDLRAGMESASAEVVEALDLMTEKVDVKSRRLIQATGISAGSMALGTLIAGVIEKVGKDGVVAVEYGETPVDEAEVVEGYNFDRGMSHPAFATHATRQEAVYEKPAIIITDQKVTSVAEIAPLVDQIVKSGKKDIVLIADEVDGEALNALLFNKMQKTLNTVVVKAPLFGERRKEIMNDIAVLTGATVISAESGLTFQTAALSVVGSARKVVVGKFDTTIIKGDGAQEDVQTLLESLAEQEKSSKNPYEKGYYSQRAAAIAGKVAVIRVGGITEDEVREKKDRVDDAVAAAKAALAEGIIPGGGITLIHLSNLIEVAIQKRTIKQFLDELFSRESRNMRRAKNSYQVGRQIVKDVLKQPFMQLMENAGYDGKSLLKKIEASKFGLGIDLRKFDGELIDLKGVGVVDPTMATKEAVRTAISTAANAATMGALVVELPELKEDDV